MAKRNRAPARARKAARRRYKWQHLPVSRRYGYTPELIADGRRRYEQTDETITSIAADFGVHKTTLQRLANRAGWVRHAPPPRDLPAAAKLAAQAEALQGQGAAARLTSAGTASPFPPPERGRVREGVFPMHSNITRR